MLMARPATSCRSSCSSTAMLAGPRRPPHVEDARQRAWTTDPRARDLRRRRAALLPAARGRLRAGRRRRLRGMHDRYHGELANELGNLVNRSDRDDRALPRRRRPGGRRRRPSSPRSRAAVARRLRSSASRTLDFTGALERAGSSCARSTASSRRARRGSSRRATTPARRPRARRDAARRSARACACSAVLLLAVLPATAPLHARRRRRGRRRRRLRAARSSACGSGRAVDSVGRRSSSRASSAARRGVIDTHAHLQGLDGGPDAAIAEAARRRASSGSSASATRPSSREEAIELARAHPGRASRRSGCTRTAPSSGATRCARELDELLGDPRGRRRWGSAVSTTTATARRATPRRAAFAGQVELAERHGKPLVIHTREAADDTLAVLRGSRGARSCCTASRCPTTSTRSSSAAGTRRSRATSPTRRPHRLQPRRRAACRPSCCCSRPTARTSRRCRTAASPNRPRYVLDTLRFVAGLRGVGRRELGRAGRGQRRARLRAAGEHGAAPAHARAAAPSSACGRTASSGSTSCVDDNLLGVIERLAELRADDVALEIGAGRRHADRAPRGAAARTCTRSRSTGALEPALSAHARRATPT